MASDKDKKITRRVKERYLADLEKRADEFKKKAEDLEKFGDFSEATVRKAFETAGGRCECERKTCTVKHKGRCSRKFKLEDRGNGPNNWQAHHRRAQSADGTDEGTNCEILCIPCHQSTPSYGRPAGK